MNDYGKAVRAALTEGDCWFHRRGNGDHDIWCSPHSKRPLTVDHTIKSRHTANAVMKQAGLTKRF